MKPKKPRPVSLKRAKMLFAKMRAAVEAVKA